MSLCLRMSQWLSISDIINRSRRALGESDCRNLWICKYGLKILYYYSSSVSNIITIQVGLGRCYTYICFSHPNEQRAFAPAPGSPGNPNADAANSACAGLSETDWQS